MSLLALLYDLQAPSDDGSCVHYKTEATCLSKKSYLDYSQSYCEWVNRVDREDAAQSSSCQYGNPVVTTKASNIAILVSCFSALIGRPIDFLFQLLNAPVKVLTPTASAKVLPSSDQALQQVGQSNGTGNFRTSIRPKTRRLITPDEVARAATTHKNLKQSLNLIGSLTIDQTEFRALPEKTVELHRETQPFQDILSSSMQGYEKESKGRKTLLLPTGNPSGGDSVNDRGSLAIQAFSLIHPVSLDYHAAPFTHFQTELLAQFESLAEDMAGRRDYMSQWGIEDGNSVENQSQWLLLAKEIRSILLLSDRKISKLKMLCSLAAPNEKLSNDIDTQLGHELLHLFVMDLLGRNTPAAAIYHAKMDAEYKHTLVVSVATRRLTVAVLIGMNAFFIYYAVLKGYVKGITWQYVYLVACLMQMMADVLVFETLETFWMDVLIPSFAAKEVQGALKELLGTVQRLCFIEEGLAKRDPSQHASDKQLFLNCAEHFFISQKVAKAFPNILESALILSYSTPFPGKLAHQWKRTYSWTWKELVSNQLIWMVYGSPSTDQQSSTTSTIRTVSIMTVVMVLLQWFAAFPYELQRMAIRFVTPFFFSALVLVWQMIGNPVIAYVVTFCTMLVVLSLFIYFREDLKKKEKPTTQEHLAQDGKESVISVSEDTPFHQLVAPFILEESSQELSRSIHHHSLSSFSLSDPSIEPSDETSILNESIDSKDSLSESQVESLLLSIVTKWAVNRNKENESESDFPSVVIPFSEEKQTF